MKGLPVAITAGIEAALNGFVKLEPEIQSKIHPLIGSVVAIEVTDFQFSLFLLFGSDNKIQVMSRYDNDVDVHIKATSLSLTRMGLSKTPNKLVLAGDVIITGDVEKAGWVKDFLAALHIDWEEQLSRLTGDIVAHKVGNAARSITEWGLSTLKSLTADTAEYVKFEKQYVPTPYEVKQFIESVDEFRDGVERMEARIARLINKHASSSVVGNDGEPS